MNTCPSCNYVTCFRLLGKCQYHRKLLSSVQQRHTKIQSNNTPKLREGNSWQQVTVTKVTHLQQRKPALSRLLSSYLPFWTKDRTGYWNGLSQQCTPRLESSFLKGKVQNIYIKKHQAKWLRWHIVYIHLVKYNLTVSPLTGARLNYPP